MKMFFTEDYETLVLTDVYDEQKHRYTFKFRLITANNDGFMEIRCSVNDDHYEDVGRVSCGNISNKKVTAYSHYDAERIMNALKDCKISTQKLKKIADMLY